MHAADALKIADFIRSQPDFVMASNVDGNYNHIGAIVADAVLQANNRYATNVRPRIKRILAEYPEVRTTRAILELLQHVPETEFLAWKGKDRAYRFRQIIDLLASHAIDSEDDLYKWLSDDSNLLVLQSVRGIGPKTADYFRILVGMSTNAIDRHLRNFIKLAGCAPGTYSNAQLMLLSAANVLSVDHSILDHSIWLFMSTRSVKTSSTVCASGA